MATPPTLETDYFSDDGIETAISSSERQNEVLAPHRLSRSAGATDDTHAARALAQNSKSRPKAKDKNKSNPKAKRNKKNPRERHAPVRRALSREPDAATAQYLEKVLRDGQKYSETQEGVAPVLSLQKLAEAIQRLSASVVSHTEILYNKRDLFTKEDLCRMLHELGPINEFFSPIPDPRDPSTTHSDLAHELWTRRRVMHDASICNSLAYVVSRQLAPRINRLHAAVKSLRALVAGSRVGFLWLRGVSASLSALIIVIASVQAYMDPFFASMATAASNSTTAAAPTAEASTVLGLIIAGGLLSTLNLVAVAVWPLDETGENIEQLQTSYLEAQKILNHLLRQHARLHSLKLNESELHSIQEDVSSEKFVDAEEKLLATMESTWDIKTRGQNTTPPKLKRSESKDLLDLQGALDNHQKRLNDDVQKAESDVDDLDAALGAIKGSSKAVCCNKKVPCCAMCTVWRRLRSKLCRVCCKLTCARCELQHKQAELAAVRVALGASTTNSQVNSTPTDVNE